MSKTEKVKRLQPGKETLRKLYLYSGNLCAFPGCDRVMINQEGVMTGRICHIEAAESGGKRFNPKMSNEDRRAFENLVLMCGDHHTIIDSDDQKYTASQVQKIKADHEAKFREIGSTLKRQFVAQYEDTTDYIETKLPKNLKRLRAFRPECLCDGDVPVVVKELAEYAGRLEKAPLGHREFLLAVFRRAEKLGTDRFGRAAVDTDDINGALGIPDDKINKECKALERYGLGGLDETEPKVYQVALSDPSDYVTLWDISAFCKERGIDLRKFLIDVDFSLLD